jgi:hypothetical protein
MFLFGKKRADEKQSNIVLENQLSVIDEHMEIQSSSDNVSFNSQKEFDLNIEKILEIWEVYHAVREIIADAIGE